MTVTRFPGFEPPPEALHAEHEANRVYGNTVRYSLNPLAINPKAGILSTRERTRGFDTVRLDVNNEGSRTHIGQAVKLGLLIETAPGYYAEAPKASSVVAPVKASTAPPAAPPAPAAPTPAATQPEAPRTPAVDLFDPYF